MDPHGATSGGLSGSELEAQFPDRVRELRTLLRQLRPYLQYRGSLVDFHHESLEEAVLVRCIPDPEALTREHAFLADHF